MIRFLFPLMLCCAAAQAKTFVLRAGDFEMQGGWRYEQDEKQKGAKQYLVADGSTSKTPAAAAVEIPTAGKWRVFVRSRDFANDRPGTRWFTLRFGNNKLEKKFGTHAQVGENGWAWEDAGTIDLPAGGLLVVAGEEAKASARCESILFTDNMSYVPEGVSWELQKERAKLVPLEAAGGKKEVSLPQPLGEVEKKPAAAFENEKLRVEFLRAGNAIGVRISTRGPNGWEVLNEDAGAASWTLIARPPASEPKMRKGDVYPDWDATQSPLLEVGVGGATVKSRKSNFSSAPWEAGECLALRPIEARQLGSDATTVELIFAPTKWGELRSIWSLAPGADEILIATTFDASEAGYFSVGFHGPLAVKPEAADSWLLPFQFQADRFPDKPVLIPNASTPTPMVLVNKGGVSCALVARETSIPFEWQTGSSSRFGFGLRNERGEAQPMIYAPVMGLEGSRSDGGVIQTLCRLRVQRGDWYSAYRKIVDENFKLQDYRKPTTFSMTDTAFNLIDLIRDEKASGWDAKAKGSVQIESRNVVSQCSPLTYMSLYLLTGDRDLYDRFARPSLEFLASRPSAHFAIEKEIGDRYYAHQPMRGPVKMYGAGVYASAFAMTQGRSPIFAAQCFDNDKPRMTQGGHVQSFDDLVMLYRVTGEKRWLDQAVAAGDSYIKRLGERKTFRDPGDHAFVNVGYAPNWEGLLYLAESTGEPRFREAASLAARQLLTTIWTQPMVSDQEITLNPGGVYDHSRGIWWWGDGKKRLGVYEGPASEGPIFTEPPKIAERKVPAWTVSNVGLGLEHPFTYVRGAGQANIMMSTWAPNFLRLAALSGDDSFRIAARNAMIGRYANYPGYYLDGQTDEFRRKDYPSKGPDITSLYLHHIPSFAASVVDFLFTDVEMRSGGKVVFPTLRQFGYVWFDNRLFGHAPGSVYGEKAWPWLKRGAVLMDDPSVDMVLAEGGRKLHIVLLNQTPEPREVKLRFNEKEIGRVVQGGHFKCIADNKPAADLPVTNNYVTVRLSPKGITALTLDDVHIMVETHRVEPPEKLEIEPGEGVKAVKIAGTPWSATGSFISAPPFSMRDFYVSLDAEIDSLKSAALIYKLENGEEKRLEVDRFPYEFSVRFYEKDILAGWRVEATLKDGGVKTGQ